MSFFWLRTRRRWVAAAVPLCTILKKTKIIYSYEEYTEIFTFARKPRLFNIIKVISKVIVLTLACYICNSCDIVSALFCVLVTVCFVCVIVYLF